MGSFTAEDRVCLILGNDLLVVFKDNSQIDEFKLFEVWRFSRSSQKHNNNSYNNDDKHKTQFLKAGWFCLDDFNLSKQSLSRCATPKFINSTCSSMYVDVLQRTQVRSYLFVITFM